MRKNLCLSFLLSGILLTTNAVSAANYVLGYSSVDEGEIRWGGSTIYSTQLSSAINTWNALGKVNIAPDTISTYEDVRISDTYLGGVGWYGRWIPSAGTDSIQLNKAQMEYLSLSWRQSVIAHELGHALGLDHHDEWNNIMYRNTSSKTSLGTQDIADYRYIYGY